MNKIKAFLKNCAYGFLNLISPPAYKNCVILMYHSVSYNKVLYAISSEKFAWQMAYLKRNGFNVISLARLVNLIKNKKQILPKSVIITFDDGYEDNYLAAWPILKKYNFPATIFLTTGLIGDYRHSQSQDIMFKTLNWEQIKEMYNSGLVDFEPHNVNHIKLAKLSKEEAKGEILDSRQIIEENLNKKCLFFCYPYGSYNEETLRILKENNFEAALTVKPGFISAEDNMLELNRNFIYQFIGNEEFKAIL